MFNKHLLYTYTHILIVGKKGRERQQSYHLLVHSGNTRNSWGWMRAELSHEWLGPKTLEPSFCLPGCALLESGNQLGFKSRHFNMSHKLLQLLYYLLFQMSVPVFVFFTICEIIMTFLLMLIQ